LGLPSRIHRQEGTFETISGVTVSTLANELLRPQWNNVSSILKDLKECIRELEQHLGKPDEQVAVMQRIMYQWKISLKTDDLTASRHSRKEDQSSQCSDRLRCRH
jgi:hypothetical protein